MCFYAQVTVWKTPAPRLVMSLATLPAPAVIWLTTEPAEGGLRMRLIGIDNYIPPAVTTDTMLLTWRFSSCMLGLGAGVGSGLGEALARAKRMARNVATKTLGNMAGVCYRLAYFFRAFYGHQSSVVIDYVMRCIIAKIDLWISIHLTTMPRAIISPSVLASDFGQLTAECKRMIIGGAEWLHMGKFPTSFHLQFLTLSPRRYGWVLEIYCMQERSLYILCVDSHFVPNITMGMPSEVTVVAGLLTLPFQVHQSSPAFIKEFLESSWIVIWW